MIVKIQPPNANVRSAVEYNERKMNGEEGIRDHRDESLHGIEDGHVLATRNVPDGKTLTDVMDQHMLEALKKKRSGPATRNVAFHMSINPSETDRPLSDGDAVRLADEIMEALGYAHQPYRVYKHTDIEREHYHVVSCRVDGQGRKVKDNFERLVLREALKKLAEKYGFTVVLNEDEQRREKKDNGEQQEEKTTAAIAAGTADAGPRADEKDSVQKMPGFTRKTREPVISQMQRLCRDALRWHFSTFEQFQALMLRRYNILAEIEKTSEDRVVLAGTDSEGNVITPPVAEQDFGLKLSAIIRERIDKEKMRNRKEQRLHLEKLARAAAEASSSFREFVETMKLKGTYVVLSWTDRGEPFGITYLDRSTRCAWKGSETATDMDWFREVAARKGWTPEKDAHQAVADRRNAMPSRATEFTDRPQAVRRKIRGDGGRPFRPVWSGNDSPVLGRVRDRNRHSGESVLNRKGYNPYDEADKNDNRPVELMK